MQRVDLSVWCALALVVGCGRVTSDTPDGGNPPGPDADAGGDATVETESALFGGTIGARVPNIDIVSMLPNNTLLAMTKTDASGTATVRVFPGGTVTAIYRHTVDMGADLITWVNVKPGDKLTFGNRQPSTSGQMNTSLGTMTISWPAQAGATGYNLFTSCNGVGLGSTTTSFAITESSLCHREPMDVLMGAFGASGLTQFNFRSNVAFASGGAVSMGSWINVATGMVNITGVPPEVTSLSGNFVSVLDANTEFSMVGGYSGTPTGGAFTGSFSWHPTGERTVGRLNLNRPGFSSMRVMDSFAAGTLTQTVASPPLPPWVQGGVSASSARREAVWILVPDANSVYDGQLLRVTWSHLIAGVNHPHQWNFILPPGQTSLQFPKLPAQFEDNLPAPQDGMGASLRVFDIASVNGYDMLKTQSSSTPMCLDCAVRAGDIQRVVFTP